MCLRFISRTWRTFGSSRLEDPTVVALREVELAALERPEHRGVRRCRLAAHEELTQVEGRNAMSGDGEIDVEARAVSGYAENFRTRTGIPLLMDATSTPLPTARECCYFGFTRHAPPQKDSPHADRASGDERVPRDLPSAHTAALFRRLAPMAAHMPACYDERHNVRRPLRNEGVFLDVACGGPRRRRVGFASDSRR